MARSLVLNIFKQYLHVLDGPMYRLALDLTPCTLHSCAALAVTSWQEYGQYLQKILSPIGAPVAVRTSRDNWLAEASMAAFLKVRLAACGSAWIIMIH